MGNHKYHKVYSDHPIIKPAAMIQSSGIIQSLRGPFFRFSAWFSQHGLNFVTLVVLMLTWLAYLRANELNLEAITAANTPWLDVHLEDIKYIPNHPPNPVLDELPPNNGVAGVGTINGPLSNSSVDISYSVENHSDTPAKRIWVGCFLQNAPEYDDTEFEAPSSIAVMPRQTIKLVSRMLTTSGKDPSEVIDRIRQAKVGIEIYVSYFDTLKHKHDFIQTFHQLNGAFVSTNIELDVPDSELTDMILKRDTPLEHFQ